MNAEVGRLPNLLIVGVPKAGTSSLFTYLGQHPDICQSDVKELGYFNHFNSRRHPDRTPPPIETYTKHWAHCAGERYAMEATPSYSYGGKEVVEGVRQVLDRPKIVITLRDPVARLWSAYTFQRSLGNITSLKSFEEYLATCEQRREEGTDLDPDSHLHGLSIGFYAEFLGHWLDTFEDDVKVVFAEDLSREPTRVVGDLLRWLGLEADAVTSMDMEARNVTRHPRSPRIAGMAYSLKRFGDRFSLLHPAIRSRLRRIYARANAGHLSERLDPAARAQVEDLYRNSTRSTADLLATHGYCDLPPWLLPDPAR